MPFGVCFLDAPPPLHRFDSAVLVPYPSGAGFFQGVPRSIPIIACGDPRGIAEAFRRGAGDYLCDPWTEDELTSRVGRLLVKTTLQIPAANAMLRGTRLDRGETSVSLSMDEAALLRILLREAGCKVSRKALRSVLWPRLAAGSRIVDETVSRLRAHLAEIGISKSCMEIHSIRGFGYQLNLFH